MNSSQPVFLHIADRIESDIITGVYKTDDLIISTTQISKLYNVNPTTAVKAVGKLLDAGVLYKRRGIGMCVAPGAKETITAKRKKVFLEQTLDEVIAEARVLGIDTEHLVNLITERENND